MSVNIGWTGLERERQAHDDEVDVLSCFVLSCLVVVLCCAVLCVCRFLALSPIVRHHMFLSRLQKEITISRFTTNATTHFTNTGARLCTTPLLAHYL